MTEPFFFRPDGVLSVEAIAALSGVEPPRDAPRIAISAVAALEEAGPTDLAYMDNADYTEALAATRAGLCLVSPRFGARVPAGTFRLVVPDPYRAYAAVLARLYPDALRPGSVFGATGISPGSYVHQSARLESGVVVDPSAVVGPGAEIGRGTVVAAGAIVGPGVRIGRDCAIGPGAGVLHALLGNRVILHGGVRVGQDGFGFALGRERHLKVAQIGRVIIQDDVEIGANSTVDRGGTRDTIIGEGTKIDNLVQVAHNVVIGRHCVIVALTGIAGSATLGDGVVLGGQVGVLGHVTIGDGAQIAASSNVNGDVPPRVRWGGTPAKPMRDWFRELTTLKKLASRRVPPDDGRDGD